MKTRTSHNWKGKPGNFDRLRMDYQYESDNEWGIPTLYPVRYKIDDLPEIALPYNQIKEKNNGQKKIKYLTHFFLDDYHYEYLWSKPSQAITRIKRVGKLTIQPDFSLYSDIPEACNIYNSFRNAWLGRYWTDQGIEVIPLLTWAGQKSFKYCFWNVPINSTVATSAMGIKKEEFKYFEEGFKEALRWLCPYNIIIFGLKFKDQIIKIIDGRFGYKFYPSYWYYKDKYLK